MKARHSELMIERLAVLVTHVVKVMVEMRKAAPLIDQIDRSLGLACEILVLDHNEPIGVLTVNGFPNGVPGKANRTARTGKGVQPSVHGQGLGRLEHPRHQQGVLTKQSLERV